MNCELALILTLTSVYFDVLLNVCHSDVMQPGGNVGEEARGPERHPGERGGLPQRAGGPADGNIHKNKPYFSLCYSLGSTKLQKGKNPVDPE